VKKVLLKNYCDNGKRVKDQSQHPQDEAWRAFDHVQHIATKNNRRINLTQQSCARVAQSQTCLRHDAFHHRVICFRKNKKLQLLSELPRIFSHNHSESRKDGLPGGARAMRRVANLDDARGTEQKTFKRGKETHRQLLCQVG